MAIDAPRRRWCRRERLGAAGQPLWWPPAKIAGRYLASYLATARPGLLTDELLADRARGAAPGGSAGASDALELTLLLADCDARWGDYQAALAAWKPPRRSRGCCRRSTRPSARQWLAAS